jgi:ADP-ribose pyrophosphatase YjhB (NUDIX family)
VTVERETREETGYEIEVTGYLGTWVDVYADDPAEPDSEIINVAYYTAVPLEAEVGPVDPHEVSDVAWFGWDDVPPELAPPGTLHDVLDVARAATLAGLRTPLADRPR